MQVTIVYSDVSQLERLKVNENYILLNENSFKTQKNARKVKYSWGTRNCPLVVVKDEENNKYLKVFYSEEFKDPVYEFQKWIEENGNFSN